MNFLLELKVQLILYLILPFDIILIILFNLLLMFDKFK
jgi:hypothetical protein